MKFFKLICLISFVYCITGNLFAQTNYVVYINNFSGVEKAKAIELSNLAQEVIPVQYKKIPIINIISILKKHKFNPFKSEISEGLRKILGEQKIACLIFGGIKQSGNNFGVLGRILPVEKDKKPERIVFRANSWQNAQEKWKVFLNKSSFLAYLKEKEEINIVLKDDKKVDDKLVITPKDKKELDKVITPKDGKKVESKVVVTPKNEKKIDKVVTSKDDKKTEVKVAVTPKKEDIVDETKGLGWFGENLPEGLSKGKIPGEYIWYKDGSVMVYVPAGKFLRGKDFLTSDEKALDELPVKKIEVKGFYIDKYEVTVQQYCYFLNSVKKMQDKDNNLYIDIKDQNLITQKNGKFSVKLGIADYPITKVTFYGAQAYANWAQKNIPSEKQWEKAARGGLEIPDWKNKSSFILLKENPYQQRQYPWGNDNVDTPFYKANYDTPEDGYKVLCPAVSFEGIGDSPYGCTNMAGNVWEWCSDWYNNSAYKEKKNETLNIFKVCRGGSWGCKPFQLRCSYRHGVTPKSSNNDLGFRCVILCK